MSVEERTPLRQDARRNRELLLRAAGEVFSEQGLDASLIDVARRAGVGNATLHRHFPTRGDLFAALYADAQDTYDQFGRAALHVPDGWTALSGYLERCCEFTASNRAVADLMLINVPDSHSPVRGWERGNDTMSALVERAHRQGRLDPAVTREDVLVALFSVQLMIPAARDVAPQAWRRQLAFALAGLRGNVSGPRTDPALTEDQLTEVSYRLFVRPPRARE